MPQDDDELKSLQLREYCLAFIAAAARQLRSRRNAGNGPDQQQLDDVRTLVEMAGIEDLEPRALTMVGYLAGIAGVLVVSTDSDELLTRMILDTAAEAAASGDSDDS